MEKQWAQTTKVNTKKGRRRINENFPLCVRRVFGLHRLPIFGFFPHSFLFSHVRSG